MLREKYGDEELSTIIREEDLSIMRAKFDSFMAAKNRFAALKGTVLQNFPPTESAANASVSSSVIVESISVNSIGKESSAEVIYSAQVVKDLQVNQSSIAAVSHTTNSTPVISINSAATSCSSSSSSSSSSCRNITWHDDERSPSSASLYYPYDALIQGRDWPVGVDPSKREQYLSPEDFYKIFKMPITVFNALDKHKKIRLKKEVRLF